VISVTDLNNSANKKDTCPADMWAKVSPDELKDHYDIGMAFKNGPRGWTMDWAKIPVGPVVDFDGLKSRWWGKGGAASGRCPHEARRVGL
jgi:hypothetical protein